MTQQSPHRHTPGEIAELKASSDLLAIIQSSSRAANMNLRREGKEWKGLCPFHNENTPSFFIVPKKQMYHCFGCRASGDVFTWLKNAEGLDFHASIARLKGAPPPAGSRFTTAAGAAAQVKHDAVDMKKKVEKARRIWDEAVSAHGTIVERYLAGRGLGDIVIPPTIRFHPKLWNAETSTLMPGMVAAMTDRRGQIVGVHRTFLRPDGHGKANVTTAKRMLGIARGAHVCLKLPNKGILAVAEGIETALTVMLAKPEWGVRAALSLGNMDAPVPPDIAELILCADGDNKDPRAAESILEQAVKRHREAGIPIVRIARPDPGKDFNDMIAPRAPRPLDTIAARITETTNTP